MFKEQESDERMHSTAQDPNIQWVTIEGYKGGVDDHIRNFRLGERIVAVHISDHNELNVFDAMYVISGETQDELEEEFHEFYDKNKNLLMLADLNEEKIKAGLKSLGFAENQIKEVVSKYNEIFKL